jgi:hypothetical protein
MILYVTDLEFLVEDLRIMYCSSGYRVVVTVRYLLSLPTTKV